MGDSLSRASPAAAQAPPRLAPIASPESFKGRAYTALKDAIVSMDVYHSRADIRLDERRLARIWASAAPRCAKRWPSSNAKVSCVRCRGAAFTSFARPGTRSSR